MDENNKSTVLIVDDERMDIITLTQILSPDYTIYAVKDGKEAIGRAEEFMPDVILLDIIMPEMDGFEVIAALKESEKTRDIPVIFITGLGATGDEERGLSQGAADYIVKPFKTDIVKLRVQNQIKMIKQMDLIIKKELAEERSRAQYEFLTRMSHEMLTPVNAIMGMTQIAKRSRNMAEIKDCLEEIDTASSQLLSLIHNLLEVSDHNDRELELKDSAFSFNAILRKVFSDFAHEMETKSQRFSHEIDPSIPMLLIGDKVRLAQVISNLMSNAVKFTQKDGQISFAARVLGEQNGKTTLQIEVADNGIGITKERQSDIFQVFSQIDSSLTASGGGTGIGLAISKQIIELMGGEIWVESEPGKGSKFIFTCMMQH